MTFLMDSSFSGVSFTAEINGHPETVILSLPTLVLGKVGNAVLLNRTTLNYGRHSDHCLHNLALCTSGLSVALWVKFFETNATRVMILDNGGFYNSGSGLSLFRSATSMSVLIKDREYLYGTWTRFVGVLEWHHVTFTWRALDLIDIYINGCPAGRGPVMNPRTSNITLYSDFRIGGNEWGGASARGVFALDHVLVWYTLLKPEEVWQLYVQGGHM